MELYALGKLSVHSCELERKNISICGLSGIKWSTTGHFTILEGHTILISGEEKQEHHGVAITVHRKVVPHLLSYNTVSTRVISVTFTAISAKPRNVIAIQCYALIAEIQMKRLKDSTSS